MITDETSQCYGPHEEQGLHSVALRLVHLDVDGTVVLHQILSALIIGDGREALARSPAGHRAGLDLVDQPENGSVSWRTSVCVTTWRRLWLLKEEDQTLDEGLRLKIRDPWQRWSGDITSSAGWTDVRPPVLGDTHLLWMRVNLTGEEKHVLD